MFFTRRRLIASVFLLSVAGLIGCGSFSKITPEVVAQHLADDRPCFVAAAKYAKIATDQNIEGLFGITKGQASAVTVLNALANGKATEVPLDLFTACQGFLVNLHADIAAIKGSVKVGPSR